MIETPMNGSPDTAIKQQTISDSLRRIALQEIDATPFDKLHDIISRTVDVELLATNEKNIGSLKIDTINDMSVVPMGNRIGVEADFSNIYSLESATLKNFYTFMQKAITAPEYEKLRSKIAKLSPEQQELELRVLFSVGLAVEYFGKYKEDVRYTEEEVAEKKLQRDQTYDSARYMIDPSREDSLKIKPLSKTGSEAICTEYAVFVKEALHKLGTDFSYVAAEKQGWIDMPSFYHSFLVSADGKTVVDPLETVAHYETGLSYGVYVLPESLYGSSKPVEATGSWSRVNNFKIA